jgi:hypothetical protein
MSELAGWCDHSRYLHIFTLNKEPSEALQSRVQQRGQKDKDMEEGKNGIHNCALLVLMRSKQPLPSPLLVLKTPRVARMRHGPFPGHDCSLTSQRRPDSGAICDRVWSGVC